VLALRTLPALIAFLVLASPAWPRAVTGFLPDSGASLTEPRPTFTLTATGFESNDTLGVSLSTTSKIHASSGRLTLEGNTLEAGSLLTARPRTPGSTTFVANEHKTLAPGTYYWQWYYYDPGCQLYESEEPPPDFYQPDCHPSEGTKCAQYSIVCYGPVLSFTIREAPPSPLEPAPTPTPTPASPPTSPPATGGPPKPPFRLVMEGFTKSPIVPLSARRFSVGVRVYRRDTGARVLTGVIGCRASVAGANALLVGKGFRSGVATCRWLVPRSLVKARLIGSIRVRHLGVMIQRSFSLPLGRTASVSAAMRAAGAAGRG
jgi:hypothetical protein